VGRVCSLAFCTNWCLASSLYEISRLCIPRSAAPLPRGHVSRGLPPLSPSKSCIPRSAAPLPLQVMYPEVRRLGLKHDQVLDATLRCMHDHEEEVTLLEDLGRLLADVRAFVRRGRKVSGVARFEGYPSCEKEAVA